MVTVTKEEYDALVALYNTAYSHDHSDLTHFVRVLRKWMKPNPAFDKALRRNCFDTLPHYLAGIARDGGRVATERIRLQREQRSDATS